MNEWIPTFIKVLICAIVVPIYTYSFILTLPGVLIFSLFNRFSSWENWGTNSFHGETSSVFRAWILLAYYTTHTKSRRLLTQSNSWYCWKKQGGIRELNWFCPSWGAGVLESGKKGRREKQAWDYQKEIRNLKDFHCLLNKTSARTPSKKTREQD